MSHENLSGRCAECLLILNRYPGFHAQLLTYFQERQARHPDFHASSGGRGQIDQELAFQAGRSKAHYGESSHNFNCAFDGFQLKDGKPVWDKAYFEVVIGSSLPPNLKWYGAPGAPFYELPHVEVSSWRDLARVGYVRLVEVLPPTFC